MNFPNWFQGNTPLQLAIERGLKPGGNLVAELDDLGDYTVEFKGDAKAICLALQAVDEGRVERQKHGDAEGSDRKSYEEWFQNHRKTFLELFPNEPVAEHGLPETTIR